ncbi:hypothetical protein [Methyloversatilis thermotolerans]|uniref:hypothetical protein n=1 Tax=Methyloversatilis thermotolerans TaxID=1346290 RepID=UPI0003803FE0|nr:hypothetical protein [Methyloversatilis thermotolerans]
MVISENLATLDGGSMDNVLLFAAGELFIVIIMAALIARSGSKDPETRYLTFGSVVLVCLALVFMLGMAMFYWAGPDSAERAARVFEACQQIIPPLLTLVIGFYLGQKK